MSILDVLFIVGCAVLYLIVGNAVLYLIDERLSEWVYDAPNSFLFAVAWTLWPVLVVLYYYSGLRNRSKNS